MKTKSTLTAAAVLFVFNIVSAQPGSRDTTFDPGTSADGHVYTTTFQDDGKIMIGRLCCGNVLGSGNAKRETGKYSKVHCKQITQKNKRS